VSIAAGFCCTKDERNRTKVVNKRDGKSLEGATKSGLYPPKESMIQWTWVEVCLGGQYGVGGLLAVM
jgi:hypothetical protein